MNRLRRIAIVRAAAAVLLAGLCVSSADAAGTPAGTVIVSRSTATYTSQSGGNVHTAYSAYVRCTVSQSAAVNITPAAVIQPSGEGRPADFGLTVVNSGNGTDRFQLIAASSKGWNAEAYADANGDGILQDDERSAGPVAETPALAADGVYKLILRVMVPAGSEMNGNQDTTTVTVRSFFASSIAAQGRYVTSVRSASVKGVLTVNNPVPRQGEGVLFTGTFTNTGSVRVENIAVTGMIAAGFTYMSATGGTVSSTTNPVTWIVGALDPGASRTVTLTLRVDASVADGTILSEQMTASYSALSGTYTTETNTVQVRVGAGAAYGVKITSLPAFASAECADTVAYGCFAANTGSVIDGIRITLTSSKKFTWNCYRDANGNGRFDPADPMLPREGSGSGVVIDPVSAGDSVRIFAVSVLPRAIADQSKDSLRIAASSVGGAASDAASIVTTINVPNVVVSKTIFPAGNHPSGSELTYTIAFSNTGHAAVENFSVVDTAPEFTEYVANSVKVDGLAAFDNEGPVRVSSDAKNATVITVSVGKLTSSRTGSVEFRVKVK